MSDLMYRSKDCGKMGRLLRFQGFADHGLVGCVSSVGAALYAIDQLETIASYQVDSPSMRNAVNVSAIFDFHSFVLVFDKSPKLLFHLGLADFDIAKLLACLIVHMLRSCGTMCLEVLVLESESSFLKRV
jgi:hypothetical protein